MRASEQPVAIIARPANKTMTGKLREECFKTISPTDIGLPPKP